MFCFFWHMALSVALIFLLVPLVGPKVIIYEAVLLIEDLYLLLSFYFHVYYIYGTENTTKSSLELFKSICKATVRFSETKLRIQIMTHQRRLKSGSLCVAWMVRKNLLSDDLCLWEYIKSKYQVLTQCRVKIENTGICFFFHVIYLFNQSFHFTHPSVEMWCC